MRVACTIIISLYLTPRAKKKTSEIFRHFFHWRYAKISAIHSALLCKQHREQVASCAGGSCAWRDNRARLSSFHPTLLFLLFAIINTTWCAFVVAGHRVQFPQAKAQQPAAVHKTRTSRQRPTFLYLHIFICIHTSRVVVYVVVVCCM